MKGYIIKIVIPVVLVALFCWGMLATLKVEGHYVQPLKTLKTPQQASVAFGHPVGKDAVVPAVEPMMHIFDPFTRTKIPVARHFDSPVGTENGAFTYNAQGYLEMNETRGGHHLGDDLNGIGGQDSDYGNPVYSAADGLVVYAATPSKAWGKVVVVAHKLTDGRIVQTMFAHLASSTAKVGDLVGRGQKIGSIGSAGGQYYAHLHYEIRESSGVVIGPGYREDKDVKGEQLDPQVFVTSYNTLKDEEWKPSALKLMLDEEQANRLQHLKNQMFSQ